MQNLEQPWINPFQLTIHQPVRDRFHLAFPSFGDARPRVCALINKRLKASEWSEHSISPDLQTLQLRFHTDNTPRCLNLFNVYHRPQGDDLTEDLQRLTDALHDTRPPEGDASRVDHLVVGDFNLHHSYWGGPHTRADPGAQQLIDILHEHQLELLQEPGMVTWGRRENATTIDMAFGSPGLVATLNKCWIDPELCYGSDHMPITTELQLGLPEEPPMERRAWTRVDEDRFFQRLRAELPTPADPEDERDIEALVTQTVGALEAAIDDAVPLARIGPRTQPGFTEECKESCTRAKRLRRRWQRTRGQREYEAYKEQEKLKKRLVVKCLARHHREAVERTAGDDDGMWKLARWAYNRETPRTGYTPPLKNGALEANLPAEKAHVFRRTFFPSPPPADLDDLQGFTYPAPLEMPPLTAREISREIRRLKPDKAPGPDAIPNRALKMAEPMLEPILPGVFNACIRLGYQPMHFKDSITVALRKPNKGDYTQPRSYRPVALLNTLGKILEAVLARRLGALAEEHRLLPPAHLGGRRMQACEHAVHLLLERIFAGWRRKQVVSLLMLDISGAFDNVNTERLLHNLKKRRVPQGIVLYVQAMLTNRKTRIKMPEYISEPFQLHTGIPQGSSLSPILYLFYNADLIERLCAASATNATGWIDDTGIIVVGKTPEGNCRRLEQLYQERCKPWAGQHASVFAPAKFELLHFSPRAGEHDLKAEISLQGLTVSPGDSVRVLGVRLDSHLTWSAQVGHVQQAAVKSINVLRGLGGSTWGLRLGDLRRLYITTVLPRLLFGCSAWYSPLRVRGHIRRNKAMVQTLNQVQRSAAVAISGGFRTTAGAALNIETHLLPIREHLYTAATNWLGRALSSSHYTRLLELARYHSRARAVLKHQSPLQRLDAFWKQEVGPYGAVPFEARVPYPVMPWWEGPTKTILPDRDAAIEAHRDHLNKATPGDAFIYTDGSGYEGKAGSAAWWPGEGLSRLRHLGPETVSNVYVAELNGVLMALEMAARGPPGLARVRIYTDNQAAILSTYEPGTQSGQYILRESVRVLDELKQRGIAVELHWIPAHVGVPGNEEADALAKRASQLENQDPGDLRLLLSTWKRCVRARAKGAWALSWEASPSGQALRRLEPVPREGVLDIHSGLAKPHSSILTQLRTGMIGLANYLHRIGAAETNRCSCGPTVQSVRHVLLECPTWTDIRTDLLPPGTLDLRKLLTERRAAIKAVTFIQRTGLLGQFRCVKEPEDDASGDADAPETYAPGPLDVAVAPGTPLATHLFEADDHGRRDDA